MSDIRDRVLAVAAGLELHWGRGLTTHNQTAVQLLRELLIQRERDEALMRQAMETLRYYASVCREDEQETPASKAIAALRERLRESALDRMAEDERELGLNDWTEKRDE